MSTNNKAFINTYVPILILLVSITVAAFYITSTPYRKKIHYPGFGIKIPQTYLVHGIDVSHYQEDINWQDVKQMEYKHIKLGFCFIKATEGTDKVDKNFIYNFYEAKQAGMIVGAYHYFNAGLNGKLQAQNYTSIVNLEKNDLPPVLDVEQISDVSATQLTQGVKEWLNVVESTYHVKPIIYSNADFYEKYLDGNFDDYPVWIANYIEDDRPGTDAKWILWQHSQRGRVNGIDGFVDFNVFSGDSLQFNSLLIK